MIQNKCMNVWKNARLEFSVKFSYNFLSRRKWAIPNLHKEYILVEVGKSIRTTVCMRQLECCVNCEKAIPIPVSYSNCNNENTQMPSLLRQSFVDRKLTMIQFSRSSERDKTSIHSTLSMHVYLKVWVAIESSSYRKLCISHRLGTRNDIMKKWMKIQHRTEKQKTNEVRIACKIVCAIHYLVNVEAPHNRWIDTHGSKSMNILPI